MRLYFKKILIIILTSFLLITSLQTVCFSTDNTGSDGAGDGTGGGATGGTGGFDLTAFDSGSETPETVKNLVNQSTGTAIDIVRTVSVSIAVVVLLVIAMKYMISSAGDRADIKKHAVAYVIGTFVLFAATQIILALVEISNTIKPAEAGGK